MLVKAGANCKRGALTFENRPRIIAITRRNFSPYHLETVRAHQCIVNAPPRPKLKQPGTDLVIYIVAQASTSKLTNGPSGIERSRIIVSLTL